MSREIQYWCQVGISYLWEKSFNNKNIKELLQVQKCLKSLTYSTVSNFGRDTIKGLQGMIEDSLEIIKIHGDIITNDELKYLKKLIEFTCCEFTIDALENMKLFIKNNGKNLKEFQLNQDPSGIPGILLSVSENCYNLNLQKIHVGYDGKPKFLADPFMNEFTQLCSSNLLELNLSNWRISLDIFETVLEKCVTFLKVLKISCDGDIKDLEIMVQIFSELHGRILKDFRIQEDEYDFDKLKLVEMTWLV
uniref:Uncharacterized protein n=1 Tax=Rhizophagus irregularis (strain DAOM 181602 / DAOM 197198 / MUCL 43194) TaxID=747089 RepID=U9TP03_RHIID